MIAVLIITVCAVPFVFWLARKIVGPKRRRCDRPAGPPKPSIMTISDMTADEYSPILPSDWGRHGV